jgi:hypothetical protein
MATMIVAVVGFYAMPAPAYVGDQWILGIHHINNEGSFTSYAGGGYAGPQSSGAAAYVGNSYGRGGTDGVARVYWELSGNAVNTGHPVPSETHLYQVEFYGTTETGHNSWQPVESQFNGAAGETFPIEPGIPWAGEFGTNHQYGAADGADDGNWHVSGPGPHTPASADFNAPGNGVFMWLKSGSWLYSKWDFPFEIDRSWSALRLTQVTVPEPGSLMLLGIGIAIFGAASRRRSA